MGKWLLCGVNLSTAQWATIDVFLPCPGLCYFIAVGEEGRRWVVHGAHILIVFCAES